MRHFAGIVALSFVLANTGVRAQGWQPEKNVEIVVGTGPGGSLDASARTMQRIWQDRRLLGVSSTVLNRPGANGALGTSYLSSRAEDPHVLMVVSNPLLTNHLTGASPHTWRDVTPLAMLMHEYVGFAVAAGSSIGSGKDFVERLRRDPAALSIAMYGIGSINHVALASVIRAAGGDVRRLKVVAYASAAEAIPAMMGGHVDAIVVPISNLMGQVRGGGIRIIGLTSPRRLGGALASAPTWREQGVDSVLSSWRGVIGARALKPAHVAWWENALETLVQSAEWKAELERNFQEGDARRGAEFRAFLGSEYDRLKGVLTELGLAK